MYKLVFSIGMRRLTLLILALALTLPGLDALAKKRNTVALVIDEATYSAVHEALDGYADAIGVFNKKAVATIVVSANCSPDLIRDTLKYLHKNKRLEGAVLIGDIPVVMVRRAHHLATAFKMDPSWAWKRSSIPSDRFYDDFSLQFDYLKSEDGLHYYDLSPRGAQTVSPDIYSARVRPQKNDPGHSFTDLISEFLTKAAKAKESPELLDNVLHFGGHGNSSESINARIDENRAIYEQFALEGTGRVSFLNFDEDKYVRHRLLEALADETLDYAHLHTHGGVDAQYVSKEPYTYMTGEYIERAKAFFRAKMRSAKDKEKTKEYYLSQYDIPASWFDDYTDPALAEKDSLARAEVDIVLEDLDGYASGVKVLILDACFNGAFLHPDYIAARYAFGHSSKTLAVFGNSVNIIQDHWKNELAGILTKGYSVGEWARGYMTLESHLFGDPTYTFQPSKAATPDTRGLRLREGAFDAAKCLKTLREDPSMNVRLEAFMKIARECPDEGILAEAIQVALGDSYELLRRLASFKAEKSGDPVLLETIAGEYLNPLQSLRVRSHLIASLQLYPYAEVEKALDKARRSALRWPTEADYASLKARLEASYNEDQKDFAALTDSEVPDKGKMFTIRAQRNSCKPGAIGPMLEVVADETAGQALREAAAEALGWYTVSYRRREVLSALVRLRSSVQNPGVADEVYRSIRRLEDIANIRSSDSLAR